MPPLHVRYRCKFVIFFKNRYFAFINVLMNESLHGCFICVSNPKFNCSGLPLTGGFVEHLLALCLVLDCCGFRCEPGSTLNLQSSYAHCLYYIWSWPCPLPLLPVLPHFWFNFLGSFFFSIEMLILLHCVDRKIIHGRDKFVF